MRCAVVAVPGGSTAGARARAAPPHSLPFHATDGLLLVRPGLGAPTGRALPRRPAPRVVLLMLALFIAIPAASPERIEKMPAYVPLSHCYS